MSSLGTLTLVGQSGKKYRFSTYTLGTVFKKGFGGVYIVTQRQQVQATGMMRHQPLLLGHSADLALPDANGDGTILASANCICVHSEKDEQQRQGIQQDLTAAFGRAQAN
jgi:hypothetical protein